MLAQLSTSVWPVNEPSNLAAMPVCGTCCSLKAMEGGPPWNAALMAVETTLVSAVTFQTQPIAIWSLLPPTGAACVCSTSVSCRARKPPLCAILPGDMPRVSSASRAARTFAFTHDAIPRNNPLPPTGESPTQTQGPPPKMSRRNTSVQAESTQVALYARG